MTTFAQTPHMTQFHEALAGAEPRAGVSDRNGRVQSSSPRGRCGSATRPTSSARVNGRTLRLHRGFKCFRREVLEAGDPSGQIEGYAFRRDEIPRLEEAIECRDPVVLSTDRKARQKCEEDRARGGLAVWRLRWWSIEVRVTGPRRFYKMSWVGEDFSLSQYGSVQGLCEPS